MIEIERANKAFEDYISHYDKNDEKILLKIEHTKRVQQVAKKLACSLNLEKEDIELAELIGLLHDIGRFEQLKIYHTFVDSESIDHADFSIQLLFEKGLIREFIMDDQYDLILRKAIQNHNKYTIEEGLTQRELLHAKLIRDADKIDILNIVRTQSFSSLYDKEDIGDQVISNKVYQTILAHQTVNRLDRKTDLDGWVCMLAFVFDFNFAVSRKYIQEKDYLNQLIDRISYQKQETRDKMEKIKKVVNDYLKEGE